MLICQILLQPAWLHASVFCPVYFFLSFTNSFYGHTWALEEEETLIWLQRPVPLQLLAHNYNSSVMWFTVCYLKILIWVLVLGTQFPFLCDFTIWLIDLLTNLPVLQSFISSNSSALHHPPLTIAPHGTHQEFTCICLSPLLTHFWLSVPHPIFQLLSLHLSPL